MNRFIQFLFCISFITTSAYSQILNQDAEGESSIVWPGGEIGIDVGKELLKFNYYTPFNNRKGWLFGIDAQGKNSTGTASLFDEGEFNPEASVSATIGWHRYKGRLGDFAAKRSKLEKRKDELAIKVNKDFNTLNTKFNSHRSALFLEDEFTVPDEAATKLKSIDLGKVNPENLIEKFKEIDTTGFSKKARELFISFQKKVLNSNELNAYITTRKKQDKVSEEIDNLDKEPKVVSRKYLFYGKVGFDAREFKYDLGNGITEFDSRFVDTVYTTGSVILGGSARIGRTYVGLNIGYQGIDTFSKLDEKNYSYTVVDTTISSGSLSATENVKAYSGEYDKLGRFRIHFDALYSKSLGKDDKYVLFGPYARFNLNTKTDILENNHVLGFGSFFLNGESGKFMGGVYLQSDGFLDGNEDKQFGKNISFGLVAKFGFASARPF